MTITNDQPIPFRIQLSDTESATLLAQLVAFFGPSLPAGLLSGRTVTSLNINFTNPPTGSQIGTGSIQIAAVPAAPAAVKPAAPVTPTNQAAATTPAPATAKTS